MGDVSFEGLSSGIDYSAIITALTASKHRRVTTLEGRVTGAQTRQSALRELSSSLLRVQEAGTALASPALHAAGPGGVRDAVLEVVDAYNAARSTSQRLGKFDSNGNSGPLFSDPAGRAAENALSRLFSSSSTGLSPGALDDFSELGVRVKGDGSATVDVTVLEDAIATRPDEVKDFFTVATAARAAFDQISQVIDPDGAIAARTSSLTSTIEDLRGDITSARASEQRAIDLLTRRFSALEDFLDQSKTTLSYLQQTLLPLLQSSARAKGSTS